MDKFTDMNKTLKVLYLAGSITIFAGSLLSPLYALFVASLGADYKLVGILFSIQFLSNAIFNFFILQLKDKIHLSSTLLKVNFLIQALAWLILAFIPNLYTVMLTQVLMGLAVAIGGPAFNSIVSENLDNKKHIREWSILDLIRNLTVGVAGLLSGFVALQFGFQSLFIMMSILALISFLIYHILIKD